MPFQNAILNVKELGGIAFIHLIINMQCQSHHTKLLVVLNLKNDKSVWLEFKTCFTSADKVEKKCINADCREQKVKSRSGRQISVVCLLNVIS